MNATPLTKSVIVDRIKTQEELEAVKAIYRAHKTILGLLPDGAFRDRFENGQIYVAKLDDAVAGYVLFWQNRGDEVRIAHLATSIEFQRSGVASLLIRQLKEDFASSCRIRLNCRADFAAAAVWPKLGFVACGRKQAKQPGRELIVFQLRLNESPLFDAIDNANELPVVICDTNICMDIEYSHRDNHESSSGLLADWLVDEVELRVTEEILNDIDRQEPAVRQRMASVVHSQWDKIVADATETNRMRSIIRGILGDPVGEDDRSDEKHLAIASVAQASAFATRDKRLLDAATEIFAQTGLRVQRPSTIIAELDSLRSSGKPHFGELQKAGIWRCQVTSVSQVNPDQFIKSTLGETIGLFRRYLDDVLAAAEDFRVETLTNKDGAPLAFIVAKRQTGGGYRIQRLRLAHRIQGTRLGKALVEHIGQQPLGCVWSGSTEDRCWHAVTIDEQHLSTELLRACTNRGFWQNANGDLTRIRLPGLWTREHLCAQLAESVNCGAIVIEHANQLEALADAADAKSIYRLEQLIHPGKASFGELQTWVVPIRPEWAQELFDFRIWDRQLFSAETNLVINPDSVYYKRPRNSPTSEFARILWYVSGDKRKGGNLIRACSAMTKRVTGQVKNLFRQYERMGVFEWKQIKKHFRDANAEATAIEFTDTELLPHPISFDQANEILAAVGMKPNQFQSAVRIPPEAFGLMYQELTKA